MFLICVCVFPVCSLCGRSIDTTVSQIEEAFNRLTSRDDVAIVLINQHVASEIRHILSGYNKTIPTVLEIPSKDVP